MKKIAYIIGLMFVISLCSGQDDDNRGFKPKTANKSKRVALLVGNSDYVGHADLGNNPVNDAEDLGAVLQELDFHVTVITNVNEDTFEEGIRDFQSKSKKSEVALFYFAGHGMQVANENYLLPVGVDINKEEDVEYECISVSDIQRIMQSDFQNRLNLIILDACRNNPFRSWSRGGKEGLAPMQPLAGTLVAYATSPGSVASNGNGRNGLFTSELIKQIQIPQRVIDIFKRTKRAVLKASDMRQKPWIEDDLTETYYLSTKQDENIPIPKVQNTSRINFGLTPQLDSLLRSDEYDKLLIALFESNSEEQYQEQAERITLAVKDKAKSTGSAKTYNLLGVMCEMDIVQSGKKNDPESYYNIAAEKGYHPALLNIARRKSNSLQQGKAMRIYKDLAKNKNVDALEILGMDRRVHSRNNNKAAEYFTEAAQLGSAYAAAELGNQYLTGKGVENDIERGLEWIRKSADEGHELGLLYLGECYENGTGVERNIKFASKCYMKSAESGCSEAVKRLEALYEYSPLYVDPSAVRKLKEKTKAWQDPRDKMVLINLIRL